MDLFTQGLLGAALAQGQARQHEIRQATLIGLFAGLLADADILISSSSDPLLNIEYHRHFTHSVFFIPFGALLAALLLLPFLRKRISFSRLYFFSLLGYCLSGFLDACTSYGTQLFWPLTDERISYSIIAIIDPVFTLALLVSIYTGWKRLATTPSRIGIFLVGIYLAIGWLQHERAADTTRQLASSMQHQPERLVVKPTLGNLLLWRSVYEYQGRFYVNAIRVGIFSNVRVYTGGSIDKYPLPDPGRTTRDADIHRFNSFSEGFIVIHPEYPQVIGDIRYANEPTSLNPLWGIKLDQNHDQQHVEFKFFRDAGKEVRQRFLDMLLDRSVSQ